MTAANLNTAERLDSALREGDLEAALALLADDAAIDVATSAAAASAVFGSRELHHGLARLGDLRAAAGASPTRLDPIGRRRVVTNTPGPASVLEFDASAAIRRLSLFSSADEALLSARRDALAEARLYFVCDAQPEGADPGALLAAAIRGGADLIQMREKAPRCAEELIAFAEPFARAARTHGALFFLNDEAELIERCGADGVHVGQDDLAVADARREAGPAALVGLSTHNREQFDAALAASGAAEPDQISAGPVWETPTKAGRAAAGLGLIEHAARVAGERPWFAIGGIDLGNVAEVVAAGATRIVVVRAIRDAADPQAAAAQLRAALN